MTYLIVYKLSTRDVEDGAEADYGLYRSAESAAEHLADALNLLPEDIRWVKWGSSDQDRRAIGIRAYGKVLDAYLEAVPVR